MKIRIKFSKIGSVKFIGHLDTMRYFQKAIRRAQLPVAYSQGFSPHQIMSFASPLGVGLESLGEYVDIEVTSVTTSQDIQDKLNSVMAEGVRVLSVRLLPDTVGNAMASVAAARYTVSFREGKQPGFDLIQAVKDFCGQASIPVLKNTKKGVKELDIRPGIFSMDTDGRTVSLLTDASSAGNIKPSLVIETLFTQNGAEPEPYALMVTRQETYGIKEVNGKRELAPLEEFGHVF